MRDEKREGGRETRGDGVCTELKCGEGKFEQEGEKNQGGNDKRP